ncbi:MAG: leucine-rich repeat domain-containing protein [Candidatus Odinarchaeota archaeon]
MSISSLDSNTSDVLPALTEKRLSKFNSAFKGIIKFLNEFRTVWYFLTCFGGIIILSLPYLVPNPGIMAQVITTLQLLLIVTLFAVAGFLALRRYFKPSSAINFLPYAKKLANFETTRKFGLKSVLNHYVSLEGVNLETNQVITTIDKFFLETWLQDGSSPAVLVLGTTGSGKSTLAEYLAVSLARKWLNSPNNNRIPVLINLRELRSVNSLKDLITDLLCNQWGLQSKGKFWNDFCKMHTDGKLLLILDGFDEAFEQVTYNDLQKNFNEIVDLVEPGGKMKVWLSTRSEVFLSMTELQDVILLRGRITKSELDINELSSKLRSESGEAAFIAIEINPVRSRQVREYLDKRFGSTEGAAKWQKIRSIPQLRELARRPITLDMMSLTIDHLEVNRAVTLRTLYKIYTDQWIKRDSRKRVTILQPETKLRLVTDLAWEWLRSDQHLITYETMVRVKHIIERESSIDPLVLNYVEEDLVKSSFLMHASTGTAREYTFQHKTFAEFFAAEDIANSYQDEKKCYSVLALFWSLDAVTRSAILSYSSEALYRVIVEDTSPLLEGRMETRKTWLQAWVLLHSCLDKSEHVRLPPITIEEDIGLSPTYLIKYEHDKLIRLDLSNCNLTNIPENTLDLLKDVRELFLIHNELSRLPETIIKLKKLETLILAGNQFKTLPKFIANLDNLRELNLSANQLKKIPEFIGNMTNLQQLSLGYNELKTIPESIRHLKNLRILDLSGNQLTEIPEFVLSMKNLRGLLLTDNPINTIPETIRNLEELTRLELSGFQLKEIPEFIGSLNSLKQLRLTDNLFVTIPEFIGGMNDLVSLELSGFQPKKVIEFVRNTESLDLGDTSPPRLIEFIRNVENLQESLSGFQLIEIPEFIVEMKNLRRLYLNGFNMTVIPEAIGKMEDLRVLALSGNKLTTLPESVANLELRRLNLSDNQFTEISAVIFKIESLRVLNLANNQLRRIPSKLSLLKNLLTLDLSGNQLNEIPDFIGDMTNLRVLNLEGNPIKKIPVSILKLQRLQHLRLDISNLGRQSRLIARDFFTLQKYK